MATPYTGSSVLQLVPGTLTNQAVFLPALDPSYHVWELSYLAGKVWYTNAHTGTVNEITPYDPSSPTPMVSTAFPIPLVLNQGVVSSAARPEGFVSSGGSSISYWEVPLIQNSTIKEFTPGAIGSFDASSPQTQSQYDVVPRTGYTINQPDDMLFSGGQPIIVLNGTPPVTTTTSSVTSTTAATTTSTPTSSTVVPVTQPAIITTTTAVTQPSSTSTTGAVLAGSSVATTTSAVTSTSTTGAVQAGASVATTTSAATSITVPSTHTGEPWRSSFWWALVGASGLGGILLLIPRRRHQS